ncbi:hypothetical protein [Streptomyces sp. BH055]|uniref:hypothetical protein n=1 Tax=unclassified Streptomyces TaxID=2593676 RepID=UPI003BB6D290
MRGAPGFVDVGRWTAGTWTTPHPGNVLALGYAFRGDARSHEKCGLTVSFGRRSWGLFTLTSRADWRERKKDPWAKASEEFQPLPRANSAGWGRFQEWAEDILWWD